MYVVRKTWVISALFLSRRTYRWHAAGKKYPPWIELSRFKIYRSWAKRHQSSSLHRLKCLLERRRKACSPAEVVVCALSTSYGHTRTRCQNKIICRRSWHGWRQVRRAPSNGSTLHSRTHRADKSWNGVVDRRDGGRSCSQVGHNVDLCVSIVIHLIAAMERTVESGITRY